MAGEASKREWSQGDMLLLEHLERRRAGYGDGMWQASALTIAGQAFLLQVITNSEVDWAARAAVLLAGLVALTAAILSLRQVRKREVEYSERIKKLFAAKGSEAPTPPQEAPRPVLNWWVGALGSFAVADVVAFFVVAI